MKCKGRFRKLLPTALALTLCMQIFMQGTLTATATEESEISGEVSMSEENLSGSDSDDKGEDESLKNDSSTSEDDNISGGGV